LQEKFDGRRILVRKHQAEIHGINRKGLLIGLPETVFQSVTVIPSDFVLDGECIGDVLFAFDVLECDGQDYQSQPYRRRLVQLSNLLNRPNLRCIKLVQTATDPANKERLFRHLQSEQRERVVFKRLEAPYTPGRPNSGGNQLKHKFSATLSAVVAKLNAQRSVELRLLNCTGWVPVGNVTIPPNQPVPPVGAVVEVRYLYGFKESNSLYQPTYLGQRKDIEQHECILAQVKFKPSDSEEE
jgi:bifunctional non-homologous end joining protein LigD